jgi:hypothetical protein
VKGSELQRLVELVDEVEQVRSRLRRARVLSERIEHLRRVQSSAPSLRAAAEEHRAALEGIAREMEAQWVAQGPLVAIWQRAVELAQQAESAGVDVEQYLGEVEAARHTVESARLETREGLARLRERREALAAMFAAAPFELPEVPAVRDDGRPEAARRDALALVEACDGAREAATQAYDLAVAELEAARAELARLGAPSQLEAQLAELERRVPESVELDDSTSLSIVVRLDRAGVRVERTARL